MQTDWGVKSKREREREESKTLVKKVNKEFLHVWSFRHCHVCLVQFEQPLNFNHIWANKNENFLCKQRNNFEHLFSQKLPRRGNNWNTQIERQNLVPFLRIYFDNLLSLIYYSVAYSTIHIVELISV